MSVCLVCLSAKFPRVVIIVVVLNYVLVLVVQQISCAHAPTAIFYTAGWLVSADCLLLLTVSTDCTMYATFYFLLRCCIRVISSTKASLIIIVE